jgi:hypothetical protein
MTGSLRRVVAVGGALVLAVALGLSPVGVRTATAAGTLRIQSNATYTLDPSAGRVHVAVKFRLTNLKPSSATAIYYYTGFSLGVQTEARSIRASDAGGALSVTSRRHERFTEVQIRFRNFLYYRHTETLTVRYDLAGGAPRSDSTIRVGAAFSTFGVWAWGDAGRGTVQVVIPAAFTTQVDGGPLQSHTTSTGTTLTADPEKPEEFFAIVSAEDAAAYDPTRISLAGGVEVVVQAWPEDRAWARTASTTLRAAIPELQKLIGLPWPVAHDLDVHERFTPALEGYAGIFFVEDQRIDVSEDLDPVVIVHETSHAWLNEDLFTDRWIYEGLAEEYAWRALRAIGRDLDESATKPRLDDPGHIILDDWKFPRVIRDQATDDRERYGYQAAFWVMHTFVESAGVDGMREAFDAAHANQTAYVGAPTPEIVGTADDWQRFLDLSEPIEEPDSAAIEKALTTYVLDTSRAHALGLRSEARKRYRALVDVGDGWLPPWYVRQAMGEWNFVAAGLAMDQADAVLQLRADVASAAAALDLEPDDALRQAYESAKSGLAEAETLGQAELDALGAIDVARLRLAAPVDLISSIGLLGATTQGPYDAARAAFERGDLDAAVASAAQATSMAEDAAAIGQGRVLGAVGGVVSVLLFLAFVVVARRRRRRALAVAAAREPYATLAADPATPSAPSATPPAANPPDSEGGPATGEPPADP